ncbi:MAG: pilin [Patescibacteria group bacterium UBA2103]
MFEQLVPACRDSICGCDFADFLQLIQNTMNFLVYFATLVLVFLLVYVGYLYVISPTNPSARNRAKGIAIKAIIGFVIVLGGFLIVDTIMNTFAKDEFGQWKSFFGVEKQVCEENLILPPDPDRDPRVTGTGGITEAFAGYVREFITTADANGLRAVYETQSAAQRQALISYGVPAGNVLQISQITAPHFSVYSSYGSGGTGSNECHDCVDYTSSSYGLRAKTGNTPPTGTLATRILVEALFRVNQNENIPSFRITEAYPKTRNHQAGCHNDGTCVDVNF